MAAMNNNIINAANKYAEMGLSPIPVFSAKHPDEAKRKRPTLPWKPYQDRIANQQEIKSFFSNGADIAVVCGAVSGGVEIIDFDEPSLFQPYMDILKGNDSQLAKKLVTQSTPSGGYHLVYRCAGKVPGNQKLAMSADGKTVLIETRGQGGYFLVHPSAGYQLKNDISKLPVIGKADRNLLIWIAQSFTELQEAAPTIRNDMAGNGDRPGDIFNRIANWNQLLNEDGWSFVQIAGEREHWTRPDKKKGATSATLHPEMGLYVFSSTTPLPTGKPLNPFGYIAYMRFHGDFSAAARWIKDSYPDEFRTFRTVPDIPDSSGHSGRAPDGFRTDTGQCPDDDRTLGEEVLAYIEMDPEPFTNNDVYSELCVRTRREKKTICDALYYYEKQRKINKIEGKRGHWEVTEEAPEAMDLLSAGGEPFNILLPLGISDRVVVRPGAIILVSGSNNAGKTVFLLSVVRNFLPHTHKHTNVDPSFINKREDGLKNNYLNSEMSPQELVARIKSFGDSPEDWVQHVQFIERTHSFDRVIDPDGINFIDYLEVNEDFFMAGKYIAAVHRKLNSGIAIIAMQKKQGHNFAKGGEMTLEKPRLAINLDKNEPHGFICKITKAKELVDFTKPIQGMECDFQITGNSQILPISDWRYVNEQQRRAINSDYDRQVIKAMPPIKA